MKPALVLEKNEHLWQLFHKAEKKFSFLWHYHDECELFVPLGGQWKYLIGNMQGDISSGEAFFLPPRLPHSFFTLPDTASPKYRCYVLFFRLPLTHVDQIAGYNVSNALHQRFQGGARLEVASEFGASLKKLSGCHAGLPAVAAFAEVLEALLHTRVAAPLAQSSLEYADSLHSSEAITRVGGYLAQHLHERLSLQQIADATCLSVPTMCRLFRQGTGHSVFEYMRELRISRVKWQLAWTDRAILTIAHNSGYESQGSFYRAFRETTGISPAAYRRLIRNGIRKTLG